MSITTKKIAIVTGGGSGLGFAIAEKFIQNNITTIIVGRDEQKLKTAKEQLGENCFYKSCNLTDLSSIPALIENIITEFGQIDILVNNAGINMKKEFTEVTDEDFLSVINTNVVAVFAISREVVKHMLTKGLGSIINISSMAAQYGLPKVIAYSASKTAIDGMTRAMAVELSPKGIRVNAIAPGIIDTDMNRNLTNEELEQIKEQIPLNKIGKALDIAKCVKWLIEDEYTTGQIISVNGGWVI